MSDSQTYLVLVRYQLHPPGSSMMSPWEHAAWLGKELRDKYSPVAKVLAQRQVMSELRDALGGDSSYLQNLKQAVGAVGMGDRIEGPQVRLKAGEIRGFELLKQVGLFPPGENWQLEPEKYERWLADRVRQNSGEVLKAMSRPGLLRDLEQSLGKTDPYLRSVVWAGDQAMVAEQTARKWEWTSRQGARIENRAGESGTRDVANVPWDKRTEKSEANPEVGTLEWAAQRDKNTQLLKDIGEGKRQSPHGGSDLKRRTPGSFQDEWSRLVGKEYEGYGPFLKKMGISREGLLAAGRSKAQLTEMLRKVAFADPRARAALDQIARGQAGGVVVEAARAGLRAVGGFDPGDAVVPFGRWYGHTLHEVPIHALAWMSGEPTVLERYPAFKLYAEAYLNSGPVARQVDRFYEDREQMSPMDLTPNYERRMWNKKRQMFEYVYDEGRLIGGRRERYDAGEGFAVSDSLHMAGRGERWEGRRYTGQKVEGVAVSEWSSEMMRPSDYGARRKRREFRYGKDYDPDRYDNLQRYEFKQVIRTAIPLGYKGYSDMEVILLRQILKEKYDPWVAKQLIATRLEGAANRFLGQGVDWSKVDSEMRNRSYQFGEAVKEGRDPEANPYGKGGKGFDEMFSQEGGELSRKPTYLERLKKGGPQELEALHAELESDYGLTRADVAANKGLGEAGKGGMAGVALQYPDFYEELQTKRLKGADSREEMQQMFTQIEGQYGPWEQVVKDFPELHKAAQVRWNSLASGAAV